MNIGIDITALEERQGTGVERVLEALLYYFPLFDRENTYFLLCRRSPALRFPLGANFRVIALAPSLPLPLWREMFQAKLEKESHLSVFFSPFLAFPLRGGFSKIATFHDPAWLYPGEGKRKREGIVHRVRLVLAVRFAHSIIAVSNWSRESILELYPSAAGKIEVARLGAGPPFLQSGSLEDLDRFGLPRGSFILMVGTLRERKNIPFALEVFRAYGKRGGELPLVVAGKDGGEGKKLRRRIREMKLERRVFLPGYLPEEVLSTLYCKASLLLFPSLLEGFGLPALEAMAAGTPVVASCRGALPEVVGDGGMVLKNFNVEEWAEAVALLLREEGRRKEMIERGRVRAAHFSWESFAQKVHQKILESQGGDPIF